MQTAIAKLLELGQLPPETTEDIALIQRWEATLATVSIPVNVAEAEVLCTLFGPDGCFGGAWTLLHLIETATDLSTEYLTHLPNNEWVDLLLVGRENAKKFGNLP